MSDSNTDQRKSQHQRPTLGFIEVQRRSKLHDVIRDVRSVLDAAGTDARAIFLERVTPLVALAVAEIAVLDRETNALEPRNVNTYGNLVCIALGLEAEPWAAVVAWTRTAPAHLARFAEQWSQHLVRASRNSESRHRHKHLVDLDKISAALNLTRPRIRDIFGLAPCALPPVRLTDRTFSLAEQREIRALAQRTGYTTRRLRDLALELPADAFCAHVMAREPMMAAAVLDKHRLGSLTDREIEQTQERWGTKRGRPRQQVTIRQQVEAVARLKRISEREVHRWRASLRLLSQQSADVSPCHDAAEIVSRCDGNSQSGISTFSASKSDPKVPKRYQIRGVEITDPHLLEVAFMDQSLFAKRRVRKDYADRELVIEWWRATRGETPSPAQIRQWAHRGHYRGYRASAILWRRELEARAREDAEGSTVVELHVADAA